MLRNTLYYSTYTTPSVMLCIMVTRTHRPLPACRPQHVLQLKDGRWQVFYLRDGSPEYTTDPSYYSCLYNFLGRRG